MFRVDSHQVSWEDDRVRRAVLVATSEAAAYAIAEELNQSIISRGATPDWVDTCPVVVWRTD